MLFFFLKYTYICREFIACFNKITRIPKEIGKLRRLRKLVLNSNRLTDIPEEIGQLEILEELILSENLLEAIPRTISGLGSLKILRLANNKLKSLPYETAEILTLEELDCSNNLNFDMVPSKWRGDSESLIFSCKVHRGKYMKAQLSSRKSFSHWTIEPLNIYISLVSRLVLVLPYVCVMPWNPWFEWSLLSLLEYSIQMAELTDANQDLTKHSQLIEQENMNMKVIILFTSDNIPNTDCLF